MKNQRQKILAFSLLGIAFIVVAGLIYVSTRVSQPTAIAPTAPISEPRAAELDATSRLGFATDPRCAASFSITEITTTPTPTATPTATPTSTPSATPTSTPSATPTPCIPTEFELLKVAFQNEDDNSAGDYDLEQEISSVSKDQTFVYTITVLNDSTVSADSVQIKDVLNGLNQNQLTFVDIDDACTYTAASRTITCNTSLRPDETKSFSFRVKVSDGAVNGSEIENTATITYCGQQQTVEHTLTVSTVVSCNHTCTEDAECGDNLICDTASNKCRNEACINSANCVCPTATPVRPISVATPRPAQPTALPEAGILDFAGVAAFGGGLLLAVVGILLAL